MAVHIARGLNRNGVLGLTYHVQLRFTLPFVWLLSNDRAWIEWRGHRLATYTHAGKSGGRIVRASNRIGSPKGQEKGQGPKGQKPRCKSFATKGFR